MDPITVFSFIGSSCSIASLLLSEQLKATRDNVQKFFRDIPERFHADFTTDEGIRLIELLVINPDLLDDLKDDISHAESQHRKCLRRGNTPQDRYACDRKAERQICETLNRIRDHNDDQLPTDYLRGRWTSYKCVRY